MLCPVRICKHVRESKSICTRCVGGPGRLPTPSPRSADGAVGGGGGRLASCVLPGDLERGRGDLWRVTFACGFGLFLRQDILAGLLGGSVWRVKLAHLLNGFQSKKINAVEQGKK